MRFAVPILALLLSTAPAQDTRIPPFHGTTLSGIPIALPEALHGKTGVLVIGFSTGSRESVTAWAKLLAADYRNASNVLYFEMPVLASVPRLLRGYVASKIKDSVPLPAQPRCVIIDSDEARWRQAAHFIQPDDAYILVVDQSGVITWHTAGPATSEAYAALRRQLDTPPTL